MDSGVASLIIAGFSALNPHARFVIEGTACDDEIFEAWIPPGKNGGPNEPTSPHWYTPENAS